MEKVAFKKKEKKVTPRVNAELLLNDVENILFEDVVDLISKKIPFKNISLPVHVSKEVLGSGDSGTTVIGYIQSFDVEFGIFTVVIFDKFEASIKALGDLNMKVVVKNYKGEVTITKFVIEPTHK